MKTLLHKWQEFLGVVGCTCPWRWGSPGRLYGVSMMEGWLRVKTDPSCEHHAEGSVNERQGQGLVSSV